jgi:hypothetical protein
VARHALSLPLWTLGDDVGVICDIAGSSRDTLIEQLEIRVCIFLHVNKLESAQDRPRQARKATRGGAHSL